MKNAITSEQIARHYKKLQQFITAVKEMVKTPSLRKLGFEKLQNLDSESLPKDLYVQYIYIMCRYYTFEFDDSQNIDDLEYSNDYVEDMVAAAREKEVQLTAKQYFVRARIKYLLSIHAKKIDTRKYFHQRAVYLTNISKKKFPQSTQFNWLKSELLK